MDLPGYANVESDRSNAVKMGLARHAATAVEHPIVPDEPIIRYREQEWSVVEGRSLVQERSLSSYRRESS